MVSELLQYEFVFDNKYQRLVEVVRDSDNRVIFLSGRGFREGEKRKYISFGEKSRLLDTKYGKQYSADQRCILVEDCYSAIKIGRQACCWPLYGTHLQHERYKALVEQFKTVHVWLDHDKFKEAMEISRRLQWAGVQSKVIVTVEDPKAQTDERIKELI